MEKYFVKTDDNFYYISDQQFEKLTEDNKDIHNKWVIMCDMPNSILLQKYNKKIYMKNLINIIVITLMIYLIIQQI